ncbi:hypothetical protein SLOPH_821 [Spraguea lophii 42_110]|uniref:Uncharacterized protein n=1 Tax=Spraguea lophii (strain 42_110) TaxID=1358809 RepID=S7WC16_SPRLO|nr:hypothetical protein SLOPH_821 [Spraguea lophii 42_110]
MKKIEKQKNIPYEKLLTRFDVLLLHTMDMFKDGDKPLLFLILPLFFYMCNIYMNIFHKEYFGIILFLFYEYFAGNSINVFIKDLIVYGTVMIILISYFQ